MTLRSLWRKSAMYVIAIVVIALDQWTKHLVRQNLPLNHDSVLIPWLDKVFTFTHVQNTGGSFGLFPGLGLPFILVALAVVVIIILYSRRITSGPWFLRLAFGLQLGGAIGNLIDRLVFGYVTDFINFRFWPVWNIADASIVVGTILLLVYIIFFDRPAEEKDTVTQPSDDNSDNTPPSQPSS
ncbi:MAG: signal peptidase II [Anaerolineae bacterium]